METTTLEKLRLSSEDRWRILLYGLAGAGKTTFAGSFPKPMLIFDFDEKLKPLYGVEGIDVVSYPFTGIRDCSTIWNKFFKDFKEAKKDPKYKTLVFDSLSIMDKILITSIVIRSGNSADSRPQIQHYGEQKDMYTFLFMEMNKIPDKNIILNAHMMDIMNEVAGKTSGAPVVVERAPLITGQKIRPILPSLFEEYYYLERKGGADDVRNLHYRPYKKANANSLVLSGNGYIENPTYEKLETNKKEKVK